MTERAGLEAERFGVGDLVVASDPIARDDLLKRMRAADALILPLYDDDRAALPIKIFEYIGAARPTIAWGHPDSHAAQLIRDRGFGVVVNSDRELADQIGRVIARDASLPSGDDGERARFTLAPQHRDDHRSARTASADDGPANNSTARFTRTAYSSA